MATYRANQAGFIDSVYREPGEIFDYEGKRPGRWMELIKEDASAVKASSPKAAKGKSSKEEVPPKATKADDLNVI